MSTRGLVVANQPDKIVVYHNS